MKRRAAGILPGEGSSDGPSAAKARKQVSEMRKAGPFLIGMY